MDDKTQLIIAPNDVSDVVKNTVEAEEASRIQILKRLSRIGLPLGIIGGLRTIESICIAQFLKEYGGNGLAADGLLSLYMNFLMSANSVLVNNIPTSMISTAYGENDKLAVGRTVQQAWILSGVLSVPIIITLYAAEPILNLCNQPSELTNTVGTYAKAISPAVPALLANMVDMNFLKSISRELDLIPYQILSVGIGIGASYIFILGKSGIEPQGAVGIGYALTLQAWTIWGLTKTYFHLGKHFRPYRLYDFSLSDWRDLKKMLRLGYPLWGLSWIENGSAFVAGLMVGWLGSNRIALNQALALHLKFFSTLTDGIRQSTQICVSQANGQKKYLDLKRYSHTGITMIAIINILPLILFSSIPYPLAKLYVSEDTLSEIESNIRIIFISKALFNIFEAVKGSLSDNLNALFDTYYPTIVQIISTLAITLPLTYILAFSADLDLYGINFASFVGIGFSIPILGKRLRNKHLALEINPSPIPILDDGHDVPALEPEQVVQEQEITAMVPANGLVSGDENLRDVQPGPQEEITSQDPQPNHMERTLLWRFRTTSGSAAQMPDVAEPENPNNGVQSRIYSTRVEGRATA